MTFGEWWTAMLRRWWPREESGPGDVTLLLVATLPFFVLTLGARVLLDAPYGWRAVGAFVLALAVRIVPWFRRPESYHLNAIGGWFLAEFVGLLVWHHP